MMAPNSIAAQDNKRLVEDFLNSFEEGNLDKILSFMSDDSTYWVGGNIPGVSGTKDKQSFGEMLGGFAENSKTGSIKLTPHTFTVQGDRVAVEAESYAEILNGRVYNNRYHFLILCRNGKIASVREYLDTEHVTEVFLK
ncbi:nuclear transport factor 2 family protein (plasmid) [Rhodococcus opacus]|uniref:nuclear transport factor 2 family protein n=1 Tax=Rhodococcus opacus TaxID=37919 RepID=UPI0034D33F9F